MASSRLAVRTSAPLSASARAARARRGSASSRRSVSTRDPLDQARRRREEHGARHRIVLGLGEKIGRHEGRIGARVGHDDHLARPRDHVDAHVAVDLALGERHVDIARAHDLVHAADGLGAVGRRRDGLRPADPVGLRHAGDPSGDEHGGIERLVGGRRGEEHDLPDARHPRGDHRHEDGGRIGGAAARDVHGDAPERPHFLAEERAVVVRHAPGARRTGLVKARDALRGVAERGHRGRHRARARRHRARRASPAARPRGATHGRSARSARARPSRPWRARRRGSPVTL